MNRRDFLRSAAAAAPMVGMARPSGDGSARQGGPPVRSIAGHPIDELRGQYRRDLFDDYLPFVDRYVLDPKFGGFMCNVDVDGHLVSTDKNSWFEGRGIWVYAFLYNHLDRNPHYLDVARRSIALLRRIPLGADRLWPKTFSREGQPIAGSDGEIYGDLFIAEGFAEYGRAVGEASYWNEARDLVLKCVAMYDRADYRPTIGQTYLGRSARPFPGARILGVWMVLLRVVTQMLEQHADDRLEAVAHRAVSAITQSHYNPRFNLINELLEHDLSRPSNEYERLVYTGHCIEMLWMLMAEARRRRDAALETRAIDWLRRHIEVAWDDVYGGAFRNLQDVDANVWSLDKVLWLQEEVLIGSLAVFERTRADWAEQRFGRAYAYVHDRFPIPGSPVWRYAGDRQVDPDEFLTRPRRLENYHHPRHLMLNLMALDRLAAG